MDEILKFVENEKFVRWVYYPNPELNDYWIEWIQNHPEESKEAEFARLILLQLQPREERVHTEEVIALYSEMIGKLNQANPNRPFRRFFIQFMRYAAVALIFLSLGVYLIYNQDHNSYSAFDQSMAIVQNNPDAQLILSDGHKINLQSKESRIEYGAEGKIIINRMDTLKSPVQHSGNEMNQLVVPYGKNSSIRLPDGTMAYLNAGSQLAYPSVFNGKQREVFLLGEGYFEVAHNPGQPFVVKTNDLSVVALGTVFNISAYQTDIVIETVLIEGQVVIRDNSFTIFKKDIRIKPNELAAFNRETRETKSRQVDAEQYVAWHQGFLNFQSTDLNRIVRRMERYYNIRIMLDDPMLGTRIITGKLMLKEDRESVLQVLASTALVELYKINETTYGMK